MAKAVVSNQRSAVGWSREGSRRRSGYQVPIRVEPRRCQDSLPAGRVPAIVERTPYNKNDVSWVLLEYFVTGGYAVVVQDVRGRYRSEGWWRPVRDDGPDGADLLKWIGGQTWSNSKAGSMGT